MFFSDVIIQYYIKPKLHKTLNINIYGYVNNIIIAIVIANAIHSNGRVCDCRK